MKHLMMLALCWPLLAGPQTGATQSKPVPGSLQERPSTDPLVQEGVSFINNQPGRFGIKELLTVQRAWVELMKSPNPTRIKIQGEVKPRDGSANKTWDIEFLLYPDGKGTVKSSRAHQPA